MSIKCTTGKIAYKFEKDAWLVAYGIYKKGKFDGSVYICRECRNYHLTSKKGIIPKWLVDIINDEKLNDK